MSTASYATGVASLALILGPWFLAAPRVQRSIAPAATGPRAWLIDATIAISGIVILTEVIGAFNGFRRVPLAVGSVVSAGVVAFVANRHEARVAAPRPVAGPPVDPVRLGTALVATVAVSAQWLAGTISSYRSGILQIESLHYHLPHAAFFAQTGTLWRPHEVSAGSDAAFHPLNVELLHGVGMVAMKTDVISLILNVAMLWLALLAAWVCGERVGAGPEALCAVALLNSSLLLGGIAGGTALNDVGVIAFLLTAVAFAERPTAGSSSARAADIDAGHPVLAGLALGLALGTKLTAPAAVFGLAAGWLYLRRHSLSVRRSAAVLGSVVATCGFWYLRDWWFFDSPVPGAQLRVMGVGWPKVPFPTSNGSDFSVAHYLADGSVIRHWFVPALNVDFGALWPAVLLLPLAGVVLAVRPHRYGEDRVLAGAAVFAFAAYLLTPTGAAGPAGAPILFGGNVRYAVPALVLALIALIRDPWIARRRTVCIGLLGLELVTLSSSHIWPGDLVVPGLLAALVVAMAALGLWVAARRGPRAAIGAVVLTVVVAAGLGLPAERRYLAHRYATPTTAIGELFATLNHETRTRIGIVGFPQSYPFYGADLTNRVDYVGADRPLHAFDDFASCSPFVRAVNGEDDAYLVVLEVPGAGDQDGRFANWARATGAEQMRTNLAGWIFRIAAPLQASRCR